MKFYAFTMYHMHKMSVRPGSAKKMAPYFIQLMTQKVIWAGVT
jgi:hypothetical protein